MPDTSHQQVQGTRSAPLMVRVCPLCGSQGVQLAHGRCINECRDEEGVIPPLVDVEVVPRDVAREQIRQRVILATGPLAHQYGAEGYVLNRDAILALVDEVLGSKAEEA